MPRHIPLNSDYRNMEVDKSRYFVFSKGKKTEVTARYKRYRMAFMQRSFYLKTSETEKIYPFQTDSIFRLYGLGQADTLKGYVINQRWMFQVAGNAIKGFAFKPTPISYAACYFKKDSLLLADTRTFRRVTLKAWVSDSPAATQLWKKQRRRRVAKVYGTPAILITCATLSLVTKPDSPISLGSAIAAIPLALIPQVFRAILSAEIVDIYNEEKIRTNRKQDVIFKD